MCLPRMRHLWPKTLYPVTLAIFYGKLNINICPLRCGRPLSFKYSFISIKNLNSLINAPNIYHTEGKFLCQLWTLGTTLSVDLIPDSNQTGTPGGAGLKVVRRDAFRGGKGRLASRNRPTTNSPVHIGVFCMWNQARTDCCVRTSADVNNSNTL